MGLLQKIFGTHSENELKRIYPIVDAIESLEPQMQKLSDAELKDKTKEFRERLGNGETLDDILPEAFATVREAAVRTLGMRHYRVQIVGGIILHQGRIAEMKTGEGKTLVSTLPAYLNALTGELLRFSGLDYTDISSDTDAEMDILESKTENLKVLYTIISYKAPVAAYNDGNPEKLMELTVYEDSNIIKEQIAPETIRGGYVAEEFLTFYTTVSDGDKEFILSLAEIEK